MVETGPGRGMGCACRRGPRALRATASPGPGAGRRAAARTHPSCSQGRVSWSPPFLTPGSSQPGPSPPFSCLYPTHMFPGSPSSVPLSLQPGSHPHPLQPATAVPDSAPFPHLPTRWDGSAPLPTLPAWRAHAQAGICKLTLFPGKPPRRLCLLSH